MNVSKLVLHNFYCYKEEAINFSKEGIYLVYGINKQTKSRNGIGKSVVAEAIKYALFNKLRTNSVDDCIRFGTTDMQVTLQFNLNGHNIVIVRSRERNKKSEVVLTVDNIQSNKQTNKMTNKYIEELVGITYEQFMHSFNYGQSEFDDLKTFTSSTLIDFLKSILNLERFNNYRDKAKDYLEETENRLNQLIGIKETLNVIDSKTSKTKLKKQLARHQSNLKNIKQNIKELKEELKAYNNMYNELLGKKTEINTRIKRLEKQKEFINKNKKCPTCKQALKSKKLVKDITKRLNEFNSEKLKVVEKYTNVNGEANGTDFKLDVQREHRLEEEKKLTEVTTKLEVLNKGKKLDIKKVEKEYKDLLDQKGMLEKVVNVFNSKGIPLYILNRYIPELELVVNRLLFELTNFTIKITTQERLKTSEELRDTCKIKIMRGDKEYQLSNLSSGEECLVSLAFRIGISKLFLSKRKFETLILDEAFSTLGEVNQDKVIELIVGLKGIFKKIIVISHISDIRNAIEDCHKISIIKEGNISKIGI